VKKERAALAPCSIFSPSATSDFYMNSQKSKKPELLCPAGSALALDAAIEGGANAVYLGGTAMNARIHAGNFTPEALREAVKKAHAYGVKIYLTLNTLVTDYELPAFLEAAWDAAQSGVDALIVADAGGAMAIRRAIPDLELHASTQMSGHNSEMAKVLQSFGFSRMVAAREISEGNLKLLLQNSPIETELFVHGALCVCHSGQCLFSSMVGGRSGNRGECAQPCRLPYGKAGDYPLSLKDLSLVKHIPKLISLGVSSLKIEGRMKSPEYVRDVTTVFRRLLDEERGANEKEMQILTDAFSRDGFTDAYFTEKINSSMLGVRREADKENTRRVSSFAGLAKKVEIELFASIRQNEPAMLTLKKGDLPVTVSGEIPQTAKTAPLSKADVERSLSRMGATPYRIEKAEIELDDGLIMPVSQLNNLRRRAVEALDEAQMPKKRERFPIAWSAERREPTARRTARFYRPEQITARAQAYFERIFLPLDSYSPLANGVVLPAVIFDRDFPIIRQKLRSVKEQGAKWALTGNLGHLSLVREVGLIPVGDYRLNITNRESAAFYRSIGLEEPILSPELTLPQLRDIGGESQTIVYGRIPLMTLEKCISKEKGGCRLCETGKQTLTDRKGIVFPVLREWEHRNIIYNSLPTAMSDRLDQLIKYRIFSWHFIFSVETPDEIDAVINAYQKGIPIGKQIRRIGS